MNDTKKKRYHMNKKLRYRYDDVRKQLLELEEDVTYSVRSQFDELAKESRDVSDIKRLTDALEDEAELLKDASEMFQRMQKSTHSTADEIHTRIKEAKQYEKESKSRFRIFNPNPTNAMIDYAENKKKHFARGNTFYKLFWVFFIGSFLGVIIEMLYCYIQNGHFESRVGLIWGPFNLVYGFGAVALSFFLYKYRNRSTFYSFGGGFIVGSVIEYLCSFFQELLFGSVSWDYSSMPFNLNGRICLLYSIFWGILGIFWIKEIYPRMAVWILRIPNKIGKVLTIVLLIFMIVNSLASGIVVYRWSKREAGVNASNAVEKLIDEYYPNEKMEEIFPNLTFVKE